MDTTELTYPVFEANQVLSNAHLNDMFEYLDEQTRLTRANLIGIGIACGLDVQFQAPGTVHLTTGCGVTSEGYLIVEPDDVELVAVRPYTLPIDYGYQPFVGADGEQYDLWELFPDDEPGSQPLATSGLFLDDKAVVLFLELRKDGLRNCSPNNCDDRGAQVTATVRRLLIDVADLDKVIAAAGELNATHLGSDLTERLELPDLRLPRFDVPNTGPVAPEEVLAGFQAAFREGQLVEQTAAAFGKLYAAFRPLVADRYPADPFTGLYTRFGFLDHDPVTTAQVRFMQYYWDLFDDLIAGYDELRRKGSDLMCACCPPAGLFPRHLMAGVLDPDKFDVADYRHHFVPSPAVGDCEDRTREVRILFQRLAELVERFTETPPLPAAVLGGPDSQIRVTPSRWGDAPLSRKAIPYYYTQDGPVPLRELWDPDKTARQRSHHNLSYRADEYEPPAPAFVTAPLRFDLEPNNFLRIEGHLGKNVHGVLNTLLTLKQTHRLPIEVVALRTGAFDENIEIDLSKEECRFEDLETLYDALRTELTCFLVKQARFFYAIPHPFTGFDAPPSPPTLPLLKEWDPDFLVQPGTMGRYVESILTWQPGLPFVAVGHVGFDLAYHVHAIVGAMSDLAVRIGTDLRQLDVGAFADRYRRLVEVARAFEEIRRAGAFEEPGLSDRLDDVIFRCRLDPFEALADEYRRRIREVKQAQFLSHFLTRHPGVQHKAGVPLGGTFVLVYHELPRPAPEPEPEPRPGGRFVFDLGGFATSRRRFEETRDTGVDEALARLAYKRDVAGDPDVRIIYEAVTGRALVPKVLVSRVANDTYLDAVAELADGAVIADFFLPYQCCSDCSPIHYTLPPARLQLDATAQCTNVDGFAEVTVTTEGATGSVSIQVDGGPFEESTGTLLLPVGEHTIVVRDDAGAESTPVAITVPPHLAIGASETIVDQAGGRYHVVFTVTGGAAPYVADPGHVVGATYTSPQLALDEVLTVTVKDAAGCAVEGRFESGAGQPCDVPCDGAAVRRGYRFWVPEARPNLPLNEYKAEVRRFQIMDPAGNVIDLTDAVAEVVNRGPHPIRSSEFAAVVGRWLDGINALVAAEVWSDQWFRLEYEPVADSASTGVLVVDRITCIDFAFELVVAFVQGQQERQLELTYNSRGTVFVEPRRDSKVRIPAFGGSTSNRCRPDDPVPICKGVELELEIEREGVFPDAVLLRAVAVPSGGGPDQPVAFVWEVQDGIPSVSGGERVVLGFDPPEPIEKLVRLSAFSDLGCVVTVERVVNIAKADG